MRLSNEIVFASTNRDKFEEFRALFGGQHDLKLIPASKIIRNAEKLKFVETHSTYLENAMAKARFANSGAHYPALADDSGLEVEALNGAPGPRTARFAVAKAGQTQDQANVQKLLDELRGRPLDARRARFVCTLALVLEGIAVHATGILNGRIAEAPAGTNGFGYDPIFIPEGQSKTLAQLPEEEKNRISHRAAAFHELMAMLDRKGIVFAKP